MATSSKIKIMISSKCKDKFPLDTKEVNDLSTIRAQLKEDIEEVKVFGRSIYEVWINEREVEDASQKAWDQCMDQARDCDVFVALFNGNAGWPDKNGTIGICHAEFTTAYNEAPGKVFIVNIHEPRAKGAPRETTDILFQDYIKRLRRFDARVAVNDEPGLLDAVRRTISESTVKLVQRGVRDASRGTNYVGPALIWSRLNYKDRIEKMRGVALAALDHRKGAALDNLIKRPITGKPILFVVNAIPDAISVPAARELVGQPHLADHTLQRALEKLEGGPVHLVACHKSVTESQAIRMLGFPNATVVSGPFGIYVVDPVQSIQLVLVAQCRDETTTRLGVQRFLEWLDESDQATKLVQHAVKRKLVVAALAGS